MWHVRAVHRRQPVLRLELLQLLNVSHVLNENNNGCNTFIAQIFDALLVDLIILEVLEGSRCAKIIDWDFQNLGVSHKGGILQLFKLTILPFIYDFRRYIVVQTHLVFFLTVEREICGNLKNTW